MGDGGDRPSKRCCGPDTPAVGRARVATTQVLAVGKEMEVGPMDASGADDDSPP